MLRLQVWAGARGGSRRSWAATGRRCSGIWRRVAGRRVGSRGGHGLWRGMRLAGRAVPPSSRQCRRGAPGAGVRAGHRGQPCARWSGRWSHLRRELAAEALATVRFETPPGRQLQIDFGQRRIVIGGEAGQGVSVRGDARLLAAHLCPGLPARAAVGLAGGDRGRVRALRRPAGRAAARQRQGAGSHHDAATREVEFNDRLHAFARYWDVRPVACAPYRARTKGKDERGVGYVKHNAIAGRSFASWAALEAHLAGGCARWPTCGCTARRARRRSRGSSARRPPRCARWTAVRRSGSCAS